MTFNVTVEWPGYRRHGTLTDESSQSSYGIPVLIMGGVQHGTADLPPEARILATWRKARVGPVWALIQAGIDAGYPIHIEV